MRLEIRLVPRAVTARVVGLVEHRGECALKVAVKAPPVDGKANEALLRLLADTLTVPRSAFSLAQGNTTRRKLVHIDGDPSFLAARLEEGLRPWLHG